MWSTWSLRPLSRSRPFALWKRRAAPKRAFRRLAFAHGLAALWAFRRWRFAFFASFEAFAHEALAEAACLLKSVTLSLDLVFQLVERSTYDPKFGS
jgi:hypothetical protein